MTKLWKVKLPGDPYPADRLNRVDRSGNSPFVKGNRMQAKENIPPESHARRMAALFRTWGTHVKKAQGKKVVTAKQVKEERNEARKQRYETTAKEAREIQEMARKNATAAMEALIDIVNDQEALATSRISAAAVILDRAYGKPNQTTLNASLDSKQTDISQNELDKRINDVLKRLESATGSAGTEAPPVGETAKAPSAERAADLRKLN